jgi:pimeloyl-ACP methyl ester carboxylesterase
MRSNVAFSSSAAALLALALIGCGDDASPAADASLLDGPAPGDAAVPDGAAPDAGAVDYPKQTVELTTGISMQFVEVGDTAGAQTVIMLHGYTHSSRSWSPTIAALTARNPALHIYALDLRGHGDSSMPAQAECPADPKICFELSDFADDVFAFMDARSITSAHLVGHGLGSLVAQEIATTNAGAARSVVLVSSAANIIGNGFLQGTVLQGTIEGMWRTALEADANFGDWPQDAYALRPRDADENAEAWISGSWIVDPTADPALLAKLVPDAADVQIGAWLGTAQMLVETNNTARLGTLAVRSLIIWATQDIVFPEADQVALRAALDVAASDCLSGYHWKKYGKLAPTTPGVQDGDLGHHVPWGAPAELAADIDAFITGSAPTPDQYFANPQDLTDIETASGAADIIHVMPQTGCNP